MIGQTKEMLDHLQSILANEPGTVKSGQYIVELPHQVHCLFWSDFHYVDDGILISEILIDHSVSSYFNLIPRNNPTL